MSLRKKILVLVVSLSALGLLGAGTATYAALRSGLLERVDDQLSASVRPVFARMNPVGSRDFGGPDTTETFLPPGTVAELRPENGPVQSLRQLGEPRYEFPADVELDPGEARLVTLPRSDGRPRYRMLALQNDDGNAQLLIAVPLDSVDATLQRLVVVELVVFSAVLLAIGAFGSLAVARTFRPLRRITQTATEVARSRDLSTRAEIEDESTEVGQLATAFNTMIGRIEDLVDEKDRSEERLRRFVGDASHELRTPLAAIRAHAEMVRRGVVSDREDIARTVRRIEDESTRMSGLVHDLLLLARLDQRRPVEFAAVDLTLIAADAVTDARALSPEHLFTLGTSDPVLVMGDEGQLRQVATNLVANTVQHTPVGTTASIRTFVDRGAAVLEVADDGPGMQPEQAALVFERFYRVDESRSRQTGGSGLGLSIVAAIAQSHGGTATVESAPGAGTAFRITLPLAVSTQDRPPPAAPPAAGPPTGERQGAPAQAIAPAFTRRDVRARAPRRWGGSAPP
jgi:two-component system, OmpR family, sensor kinase